MRPICWPPSNPDGGFVGREGGSDLYYTGFALRGLAMLGELYGPVAERSAAFLHSRLGRHASVIDVVSLVYSAALLDLAAGLDVFGEGDWRDSLAGHAGATPATGWRICQGTEWIGQQHLSHVLGSTGPAVAAATHSAIPTRSSSSSRRSGRTRAAFAKSAWPSAGGRIRPPPRSRPCGFCRPSMQNNECRRPAFSRRCRPRKGAGGPTRASRSRTC